MKKIINLIMALSIFAAAPVAMAEGPLDKGNFSANFALTTDYMYRGITQSNEQPAVSGGFDWAYETGSFANVYAGIWASRLEFRRVLFRSQQTTQQKLKAPSLNL